MTDHDTEGLLKEIDDGPFIALGLLADKARDRGEDALAAAFDWLVAWRRYPDRLTARGYWRWRGMGARRMPRHTIALPYVVVSKMYPTSDPETTMLLPPRSPNYPSLSGAYMDAAKALAETMPMEFLNQRPKAKKGKK